MARLHYQHHELAVPLGTFFIGRGSECQLALDDPLVSRKHAAIRIYAGGALIEDLGSRNGVYLNGVRIEKAEPLGDGDQIRIGSQDLSFYENSDANPLSSERATRVTRREMQVAETRQGNPDVQTAISTSPMGTAQPRGGGLSIIGGVADKALALGRADDAERILQRSLDDLLVRAGRGEVDAETAERAAGFAVRLAAATGRGVWVDYTFRLYTAQTALLPARIVDELYAAVRKVKHTDKSLLRAYTARLRQVATGFGPAERFVLQRIEGFERWAP
jgi:pSer/pThr/pTyr-binding forkhead associated (FHA) protein